MTQQPEAPEPKRQERGRSKRDALVRACAELILEIGPTAVTHRAIAQRAEVSLASTTYYFRGLSDLVEAAGAVLVADWVRGAREVLAQVQERPCAQGGESASASAGAELVVRAILPAGDDDVVRGHYEHLVAAGRSTALATGYARTRPLFDDVVGQLLAVLGLAVPAHLAIAVVDGAAIAALSEGRGVREHAAGLLTHVLTAGA